jgi:hypothetical protein
MNTKSLLKVMTAFGFLVTAASFAQAEIIQYNYNQNYSDYTTTPSLVPITSTGATSINFVAKKAGLVGVTFSAECSVSGSANNYWLGIDILIDGVVVAPTGSDDAFCTEVPNTTIYGMNSITVAKLLTKGTHTLTVRSYVIGDTGRLDDVAVTVWR